MTDIDKAVADALLTTTRAVRRRLDLSRPVPPELITECIEIAQQAPTAGNRQVWSFLVVTDPELRSKIADIYRSDGGVDYLRESRDTAGQEQTARVYDAAVYLAEVLDQVPVLVIPCMKGRIEGLETARVAGLYGSIMPAAWSFMLAARARGLGTAWTSLHLFHEQQVADLLGIPAEVSQVALIPVAYYTGSTFSPASRPPAETITHWNGWSA